MITEDYVSFETAKLLKEKGFDARCPMIYTADGEMLYTDVKHHNMYAVTNKQLEYYTDIIAPTLQMARRWLMAIHNLFITFELDFSDGAYPMFDAVVYNLATCEKYPIINYDRYSYIKGTEAAIKYCLENLI